MQIETWSNALHNTFAQLMERIAQYLPTLFGAGLLVIAGWIVAKIVKAVFLRVINASEKMLHRFTRHEKAEKKQIANSSQFLGNLVFWIVILFFLTAASNLLQLKIFSEWLNKIVSYLPSLLAGGIIILIGYVLSSLLRETVLRSNVASADQRLFLAKFLHTLFMVVVVLIGLDQIGVNVTVLVVLFTVIVGSVVGSLALAVSLGARFAVSNLIGAHYLRQTYRVGQQVRIGDQQGKILDLTATALILETSEGSVALPAKLVHEMPVTLLDDKHDDD